MKIEVHQNDVSHFTMELGTNGGESSSFLITRIKNDYCCVLRFEDYNLRRKAPVMVDFRGEANRQEIETFAAILLSNFSNPVEGKLLQRELEDKIYDFCCGILRVRTQKKLAQICIAFNFPPEEWD